MYEPLGMECALQVHSEWAARRNRGRMHRITQILFIFESTPKHLEPAQHFLRMTATLPAIGKFIKHSCWLDSAGLKNHGWGSKSLRWKQSAAEAPLCRWDFLFPLQRGTSVMGYNWARLIKDNAVSDMTSSSQQGFFFVNVGDHP